MITLRAVTWIFWLALILGHHHFRSELRGHPLRMLLLYAVAAIGARAWGQGLGVYGLAAVIWLVDVLWAFLIGWLRHARRHRSGSHSRLELLGALIIMPVILSLAQFWRFVDEPLHVTALDTTILRWAVLLALLTKPANSLFKRLFARYQEGQATAPQGEGQTPPIEGAGAVIGNLERIISAILFSLGQFGTVAVIYTAKSIARYDRIAKHQAFAEYYLIGTLYSILYVLAAWILTMHLLA